jgi:hypothetical protein
MGVPEKVLEAAKRIKWSPGSCRGDADILATWVQSLSNAVSGETAVAVLPAWWVSWYSHTPSREFELHSPWWVSGERSDGATVYVAAVRAVDESAAWDMIRLAYDHPAEASVEERFIEALDGAPFTSRFPQASWMEWDDEGHTCRCEAMHSGRDAVEEGTS